VGLKTCDLHFSEQCSCHLEPKWQSQFSPRLQHVKQEQTARHVKLQVTQEQSATCHAKVRTEAELEKLNERERKERD